MLASFHDTRCNKTVEALCEDVGRQVQAALIFGEPGEPAKHRVPQDQRAPPLADQFQGASRRADLFFVKLSKHGAIMEL